MDQPDTTYHMECLGNCENSVGERRCISSGGKNLFVQPNSLNDITRELSQLTSMIDLNDQVSQTNPDFIQTQESIVIGLSLALYLRDPSSENHTIRVSQITQALARKMTINGQDLANMRHGALLHDIGKLGIPDYILRKPGKLNKNELDKMKTHPILGFDILSKLGFLAPVIDIPLYHHEHWDGAGYPFGLTGCEIPYSVRIFSVVDVWDALTSNRPYRPAWTKIRAKMYIKANAGKQFDPDVVNAFFEITA